MIQTTVDPDTSVGVEFLPVRRMRIPCLTFASLENLRIRSPRYSYRLSGEKTIPKCVRSENSPGTAHSRLCRSACAIRGGGHLRRPQETHDTPLDRRLAVIRILLETNLPRKKKSARVHRLVAARAIQQRVTDKAVCANANAYLRGSYRRRTVEHGQLWGVQNAATFKRAQDAIDRFC